MPYLIAAVVVIAACWWVRPPLGVAVAVLSAGKCRLFVVPNAAFWSRGTILMIGIAWGVIMAVGISLSAEVATVSRAVRILLLVEGFFAVGYVGYAPAPEDRMMYNKAGQTANLGMICYVLTAIAIAVLSRP